MGDMSLEDMLSDDQIQQEDEDQETPETPEEDTPDEPEAEAPEVQADEPAEPEEDPRDRELAGLKAALQETRGELRAMKATQAPQPEPAKRPDAFDDPNGALEYTAQAQQQQLQMVKLDLSEDMARSTHGDEAVDAAFAAFKEKADRTTYDAIMKARSPWNEVVKWHKREQVMSEIGDDPAAWREAERAAIRAELQAEANKVAENVTRVGKAPSLASEPNLGSREGQEWSGPMPLDKLLG